MDRENGLERDELEQKIEQVSNERIAQPVPTITLQLPHSARVLSDTGNADSP